MLNRRIPMKKNVSKNISNSLQIIGFFICFFSLFIFTYSIRRQIVSFFSQRTFLWGINYCAYIGFFLIFIAAKKKFTKENIIFYILPVISLFFPMQLAFNGFKSLGFYIMYSFCCAFSLYFIMLEFSPEIRPIILRYFIICFSFIMTILLIWALIDHTFGQPILKWLTNYMTSDSLFVTFAYPTSTESNRFYSFFGQPIRNATLFNSFYVINILYNEKHKPVIPSWLCCIMVFLAIACCGSKTGLFVCIAITVISFYRNIKLLFLVIIVFIAIAFSGTMDNLILRLTSQPLSTGRWYSLKILFADSNHPFHLFHGYGSVDISNAPFAAFEFPFTMFSFEFGVLFAILILGTLLIYVSYHLLKQHHMKALFLWLLLFGEVNTYPSIAQDEDHSLIFCFLTMIILNICYDNNYTISNDIEV